MLRVRRDDPDAFAELLRLWEARVFARFLHVVHDRQEAEDLTQEVFLRLYRSRKRYEARARFTTWLYHVTQNVARNALRRRRRHACLHFGKLGGEPDADFATPAGGPDAEPSHPIEQRELAAVVRGALASLMDRQRAALEMQQFEDRSCAEIADALATSTEATKSLLYRARLQLRGTLSGVPELA
jgi:RNA polymerase sigma-70 factor (ECF subfamily)